MTWMVITDDIGLLTEILRWLPAKSLIRFKLVCKQWLSLISIHYFSQIHTLHHSGSKLEPSVLVGLAEKSDYFYYKCSLHGEKLVRYHVPPTLNQPTIRSGSNGLFLLQCPNAENPLGDCYIYNPTTKQSRKIILNVNDKYTCVLGLNLVFEPVKSPHYKIICFRATKRRSSGLWRSSLRRCQVEVYESETRNWKLSEKQVLADPLSWPIDDGKYSNGGIHWDGIFFDLHDFTFQKHPEIVFPQDLRTHKKRWKYIESNGYLHHIAHFYEQKLAVVLELQRDHSQWAVKYRINLDGDSKPLCVESIVRGESEEDSTVLLHGPGKIVAYKVQEKTFKELIDFREAGFYQEHPECYNPHFCPRTFQFIETLAPV
ncbi:hypothetical protein CDL12_18768 [Handroanthus impetiginosus]|uniref:F-box domain-containing protein n=1 Tax=Handroanthus impetiginosus TaxID=429701 RepID=A0A2G9GTQ2_9LAMI|nr:hypothetical protein CDL12_18768 [Handroanthus impetiginosus]